MSRARYRPTFALSTSRRPMIRRLTPLAWTCAVLAALGVAGALSVLAQQPGPRVRVDDGGIAAAQLGQPRAQSAPAPTVAAPQGPSALAGADVVTAPSARLAPWSGEMRRLDDGQVAAPIAASQAARDAIRQALEQELALGRSSVIGAAAIASRTALLQATRIGPYLSMGEQALHDAAPGPAWQALNEGVIERISIFAFSPDGLACDAFVALRDARVTLFDGRGMRVSQEPRPDGLWRYRLRYDLEAGRWKLADLLEFAPAPVRQPSP